MVVFNTKLTKRDVEAENMSDMYVANNDRCQDCCWHTWIMYIYVPDTSTLQEMKGFNLRIGYTQHGSQSLSFEMNIRKGKKRME